MNNEAVAFVDIQRIMDLLPHRYPFLLVDRVLELQPGISIHALKNVSCNEPFFQGHFPGRPIMPGVLICEALAQAGALLLFLSQPELQNHLFLFAGIEKVRFRAPVVPGDQLHLHCTDIKSKFNVWKMNAVAKVDGAVVAQAAISAALTERRA